MRTNLYGEAELATIVRLVAERDPALVNVGHGRSPRSALSARAFVEAWEARGGTVGAVVSWPPSAASWLRPACRLVAGHPDLWVIADEAATWSGVAGRLVATGAWRPTRTVAFAGLADPRLPDLAGPEATDGLVGSRPDGSTWAFGETLGQGWSPGALKVIQVGRDWERHRRLGSR